MPKNKHLKNDIREDCYEYEDEYDCHRDTPLDQDAVLALITAGDFDQLRNAIDRGTNINFVNKYRESPLHIAVKDNESPWSIEIIDLLVYFGCPVGGQDRFGQTPLHIAVGHSAVFTEKLLNAGAPVNCQDNGGRTALMLACGHSGSDKAVHTVQMLLDRGANIHATDRDKQNALHYLCNQKLRLSSSVKQEIAFLLMYAGINVNSADHSGTTAVRYAYSSDAYCAEMSAQAQQHSNRIPAALPLVSTLARGGANFIQNMIDDLRTMFQKNERFALSYDFNINEFVIFGSVTRLSVYKLFLKYLRQIPLSDNNAARAAKYISEVQTRLLVPQSLKELSRVVIRDHLNGKVLYLARHLGLPSTLEQYLTYPECVSGQ